MLRSSGDDMTTLPETITIAGSEYPVQAPDFATRHDIFARFRADGFERMTYVCAATMVICCPTIGPLIGFTESYDGDGLNMWRFGRRAYSKMYGRFTSQNIQEAGGTLVGFIIHEMVPTRDEVSARVDFSSAQPAAVTS